MILPEQIADFLSEKQRKKSRATADQYRFVLERVFLPWAQTAGLYEASDCTDKVMDKFQDHLLSRTLSVASVRTYVRGVRIFLNWCGVAAGRFESVSDPQRLRDTLSRDEIQRLEKAAKTERDRLIVRVLADTGVRISELLGMRLRDLRETHEHHTLIRVIGKGNKEREVTCPPDTFRRLRKLAMAGEGDYIFMGERGRLTKNGAEQMMRKLAERAKIGRRVWPHLLRHTYATQQLRKGTNLVTLQRQLGHTSLAMVTQVYAHTTPDDGYDELMKGLR